MPTPSAKETMKDYFKKVFVFDRQAGDLWITACYEINASG
jgi:hypothetical protein